MPTYRTPDVYVEEISVFPPSVAEVETAIPAFIGYTEKAKKTADNDLILKPTKIFSFKEYENYYGFPEDDAIAVTVADDGAGGFTSTLTEPTVKYLMYYSVKMFFDNGGGKCYIVSVGTYQATPIIDLVGGADATAPIGSRYGLQDGLDAVKLEDEPTLIVIPEAVKLTTPDYTALVQSVLLQCNTLGDRFAIFDIYDGGTGTYIDSTQQSTNRGYFGNNYLKYGAAYYPFVKTTMNFYVNDGETNVDVNYADVKASVRVATVGATKSAVRVATAGALPAYAASGTPTTVLTASADGALPAIDGVALVVGDRILLKDETGTGGINQKYNGIYTVTNIGGAVIRWTLTRASDADSNADVTSGLVVSATAGAANVLKSFKLTTVNPIILDTTALVFGEVLGALPLYTASGTPTVLTAVANGAFPTIDVVATPLIVGDRILVKDETATNQKYNGIYTVTAVGAAGSPWILTRATDADSDAEVTSGLVVSIREGAVNTGKEFAITTVDPITLDVTSLVFADVNTAGGIVDSPRSGDLSLFKTSNTAVYNFVKAAMKEHFVVLPPSGAVAGVYAATDTNRGVWKAPANVSLSNVIEPVIKLDNAKQDSLNVDATSGKSIDAIRAFVGKGTLVWGARTLAGNDNEWRYVNVRRFFNMVEESVKKSTYWAVFEPNDANLWVKVRGMIENYLTQKWREGALAGATTKDAFFVRCGLGTTMTSQDILEGRMNVEIGMAAVRPAEFIILKFSHKLQTS